MPLHFPVLWTHGLGCPFWRVWEPTWAAMTTAVATTAWPLTSRHRFWRKEATQGLEPPVPVSLASPQARITWSLWCQRKWCNYPPALGQPGGKCPVTAWVWLASGLQACTLSQTHSKGAAGEPVFVCTLPTVYLALCTAIRVPQRAQPGMSSRPLAFPFLLIQFTSCPDYKHLFPSAWTLWDTAILLTSYA